MLLILMYKNAKTKKILESYVKSKNYLQMILQYEFIEFSAIVELNLT